MMESLTRNTFPRPVHSDWSVSYRYTHGVAGERFLREMQSQQRLLASVCPKCKRSVLPPSLYCEDCFLEMGETRVVEGQGTIHTFTVLHDSLEETKLDRAVVVAFVQFDGISGGLLGPLEGVAPDQVKIGMKVKASFNTKSPTNSILDLAWVPA